MMRMNRASSTNCRWTELSATQRRNEYGWRPSIGRVSATPRMGSGCYTGEEQPSSVKYRSVVPARPVRGELVLQDGEHGLTSPSPLFIFQPQPTVPQTPARKTAAFHLPLPPRSCLAVHPPPNLQILR